VGDAATRVGQESFCSQCHSSSCCRAGPEESSPRQPPSWEASFLILRSDGRGEKEQVVETMELVQELKLQTLLRATKIQK
jgi:hypothetical protein